MILSPIRQVVYDENAPEIAHFAAFSFQSTTPPAIHPFTDSSGHRPPGSSSGNFLLRTLFSIRITHFIGEHSC